MPIETLLEKSFSKKSIEASSDFYDVNREYLTPIKRYLQQDPDSGTPAALYLVSKLMSKSVFRRAKVIFLIDYLACRCLSFRVKLFSDLSFVNEFLAGADGDMKIQFAKLLQLWDLKFGNIFPNLRCTCRYLRESAHITCVDVVVSIRNNCSISYYKRYSLNELTKG